MPRNAVFVVALSVVSTLAAPCHSWASPPAQHLMCVVDGVELYVPLRDFDLPMLLRRSLLYTPRDTLRDGWPWFGAVRDYLQNGKPARRHYGIDIYGDSLVVLAAADGVVTALGRGKQWGGSIRLQHNDSLTTLYVHLSRFLTYRGAQIKRGEPIAVITAPEGNAADTQLHFGLIRNSLFVDPVPFIKRTHRCDAIIQQLLNEYEHCKLQHSLPPQPVLR